MAERSDREGEGADAGSFVTEEWIRLAGGAGGAATRAVNAGAATGLAEGLKPECGGVVEDAKDCAGGEAGAAG